MATKTEADGEHPAGHYLVIEDPAQVSTWHLRVRNVAGELDHRLMGAAWAALHGGYRGNKYEGPGKQAAIASLKKLYAQEDMPLPGDTTSFVTELQENLVSVRPGEPFRLMQFGEYFYRGQKRTLTPEKARAFKLPHFKPPIKLGSHDDATPGGGTIQALQVRSDGLYVVPQLTDKGAQALAEGYYRYHSPEIIWEEGGIEDHGTGKTQSGPMVVGVALLHTPHLGESTALYSAQSGGRQMGDNTVTVPQSFFDKLTAMLGLGGQPNLGTPLHQQGGQPSPDAEKLTAALKERDELKAQFDKLKADMDKLSAERQAAQKVADLVAELKKVERFGAVFADDKAAVEAAQHLASLSEAEQKWFIERLAALATQIKESNLVGAMGDGSRKVEQTPVTALNAAVAEKMSMMAKSGAVLGYADALQLVIKEKPDLYAAYQKHQAGGK